MQLRNKWQHSREDNNNLAVSQSWMIGVANETTQHDCKLLSVMVIQLSMRDKATRVKGKHKPRTKITTRDTYSKLC